VATATPGRFATRGQEPAVAAVRALLASGAPHAVMLIGPASSGKTTLGLDLAAALLCGAPAVADRPCGDCRGCRLVAAGAHPDLHRLAPSGPGREIRIGEELERDAGTIRGLIATLALLPVEGGARVALVEDAGRMNEMAQNAILRTLEEPPAGVTIVLCVDDEAQLLPTVRSRCARIRLGPVAPRVIEGILVERGLADAPTGARLARLAAGRPGLAIALAASPGAVTARSEIARTLLDLLRAGRAGRLAAVRELVGRAGDIARAVDAATEPVDEPQGADEPGTAPDADMTAGPAPASAAKRPAAERRRAALALLGVWRDVGRDLLVVSRGGRAQVVDHTLLEELESAVAGLDPEALAAFLGRLDRTAALIAGNVNPELALDVLVLAWPTPGVRA
jgi:DNA polymerase-3 subunit delta'